MQSEKNASTKLKLEQQPFKKEKSWLVNITGVGKKYIPFSVVQGYEPAKLLIEVEVWWLMKNEIPFKV